MNDIISGSYAAGGLYAVSLGRVVASQVTAVEDAQFNFDTTMGDYVLHINDRTFDNSNMGNTSLVQSNKYAGGLIGVGLNAKIDASYAKASFSNSEVIGGLIGLSVASNVTYSYAIPFVSTQPYISVVGTGIHLAILSR